MTDGASAPPPPPPGSGTPPAATGTSSQPPANQTPTGQTPSGQTPSGQPPSGQPAAGQTPGSQTAAPPPATSTAQAQQALPADLARAPAGTVIEAEAVSRNADGSVTIRTAQGDIRADLTRAQVAELLRTGTRVTVELRNPTSQPPQLVVTVRGGTAQVPAQPAGQTGAAAQPAVSTAASGPAPTVPLAVGRILQAVAVPGPAAAQAAAQVAAQPVQPTPAGGQAAPQSPATPGQGTAVGAPTQAPGAQGSAAIPAAAGQAPGGAAPGGAAPGAQIPTGQAPAGQPTPGQTPAAQGAGAQGAGGQAAAPAPPLASQQALPQPAVPSALAVQSAYRNALGLTGRAPQAAPTAAPAATTTQAAQAPIQAGQPAGANAGAGLAAASPNADASGGGRLPTGAIVTVRVLATGDEAARFVGARGTGTPSGQQAATGGNATVLSGTVAGVTQSGRPVVATPFGHLALNATSELRIGDRVALDVLASRVGDMPTAERAAPLSVLAREWPALDGAMRALQEGLGPQAAAQITQAMVRPSPQMTAAMLFFMTALKGGDMRSWFGQDASRALEQAGRGGLLSALAEDFQTLQRATEPLDNGWRAFLIPVVGNEKRPIRLMTRGRRRGGRGKDGEGQDGTAFLVDLELTALGPFRLDGLVRGDLIDLWIRTTKPLPGLMRHDIKALFDDTLDRTGIQGRLAFKATPVLPPLPVPDLEAGAAGDTESLFA